MTLTPERLRQIRTLQDVIEYLVDELDWPIGAEDLDDATFDWDPTELGLPLDRVPTLASLRELRPLEGNQPWGIFFIDFDGPRLPVTALRRLLDKLVTKKRATGSGTLRTWRLDDLLFIITTTGGDAVELHFVAFYDLEDGRTEIRSIPWRPEHSPARHLARLAGELLPHLAWPDDPSALDAWREQWRSAFKLRHGEAINTVSRLVDRMATTARTMRERIAAAVREERGSGPFSELLDEVRAQLVGSVTTDEFADMCAQTLVYGAMTSRVTDPVGFGASPTLANVPLANPFLAAFFEEVHDHAVQLGGDDDLEQLVADLRVSQVEAILDQFGSTVRGGDPVIHFYEEFLHQYDPEMKVQAGAFYTPQPAVRHMVRTCDEVLRTRLSLPLGVADPASWGEIAARTGIELPAAIDPESPFVSALDPATGTGTFLVEWIRQAKESFLGQRPAGEWSEHAAEHVIPSLHALELMLAPYAVAHLKTALELHDDGIDGAELGIFLTDTLHRGGTGQLSLEPDAISVEGQRADEVKRNLRATVCLGNPPYDRVARDAGGGWITDPGSGRSLFDDILDPARAHTIFSHHASLYNKFVYFWRWALWKVFEDRPGLPGVVSLITPNSWLTGPGFLGLRQLVRELADEVWVVDLGGDNRGTRREENIFEIETPVAIVTVCRSGAGDRLTPATVRYRRILGTADEKLQELAAPAVDLDGPEWQAVPEGWHAPFTPSNGNVAWNDHPALTDLFPWQQPGCKYGRTWPISVDRDVLVQRWTRLVSSDDPEDRERCFITPSAGRNIFTQVGNAPRIVDEPVGASSPPIVRYGFRSFDRQWAFDDPRMTKTESPSLWASVSDRQIFMATMPTNSLGTGAAASVTPDVPDLHFFCGRGGKDVLPLYRNAQLTPNADQTVIDRITTIQAASAPTDPVTPERLFAYCYAVLAGSDYTSRFRSALETPGPRVPLSADPRLFDEVAALGRRLIWLHTYGERFGEGQDGTIRHHQVRLLRPITSLPGRPRDIRYDTAAGELALGGGVVSGVLPEVWDFEVSGMQVVKKWLGYRTATPAGRAASSSSPLDRIRPTTWKPAWTDELLDLLSVLRHTVEILPEGAALLDRICDGPLIAASDLPEPDPALRQPPAVPRRGTKGGLSL